MRVKLLTTISFFTYQLSISQTEKVLHGKVLSQNIPLNKVEVINKTSKTSTQTNEFGEFSIPVHENDSLIFFAKDYFFKRIKITPIDLVNNNLIVNMVIQPVELENVVVLNKKLEMVKMTKEEIKEIKLNKTREKEGRLKIIGYKEAIIPNAVDFIRLGKQIKYLFEKEKIKIENPKINFIQHINNTLGSDFFIKELKLQPEEKQLFLEYCDADPRSKEIIQRNNVLVTMDFLFLKNEEFTKLKAEIKN